MSHNPIPEFSDKQNLWIVKKKVDFLTSLQVQLISPTKDVPEQYI